ncbi:MULTISPECIES: hypothetical protein [unclassified Paenibacillus]|uniref:hypothetical protein n=1 Tax=unclassified Paenibacillus TaxID=185978 RepID=UPI000467AC1D|nr:MULTISPECIES: hypothetical protein [unclassified Paenibacillus]
MHVWTDAVRATDSSTTAQAANGTNPRNLLYTSGTYPWIDFRKDRSGSTGQASCSWWGEQAMQTTGKLVQIIG